MAARTTWPERSGSTQDQLCTAKRLMGPTPVLLAPWGVEQSRTQPAGSAGWTVLGETVGGGIKL